MKPIVYGNLTIPVPDTWTDGTVVTLLAPVEHGFRANVLVSREMLEGPFDEFVRTQMARVKKTARRFQQFEDTAIEVSGLRGRSFEYRFLEPGGKEMLRQRLVLIEQGSSAIMMSMTDLDQSFERVRPQFQAVLDGLKSTV